jgi:hypothetical protein
VERDNIIPGATYPMVPLMAIEEVEFVSLVEADVVESN